MFSRYSWPACIMQVSCSCAGIVYCEILLIFCLQTIVLSLLHNIVVSVVHFTAFIADYYANFCSNVLWIPFMFLRDMLAFCVRLCV